MTLFGIVHRGKRVSDRTTSSYLSLHRDQGRRQWTDITCECQHTLTIFFSFFLFFSSFSFSLSWVGYFPRHLCGAPVPSVRLLVPFLNLAYTKNVGVRSSRAVRYVSEKKPFCRRGLKKPFPSVQVSFPMSMLMQPRASCIKLLAMEVSKILGREREWVRESA